MPEHLIKFISQLDVNSSAGFTEIPVIVIKTSSMLFSNHLSDIINDCIRNNCIPDDWKVAVVTPLYKNKGDEDNCNNYRGISVLSPFVKLLENISTQIQEIF
jgi:hypothetical protein